MTIKSSEKDRFTDLYADVFTGQKNDELAALSEDEKGSIFVEALLIFRRLNSGSSDKQIKAEFKKVLANALTERI